MNAATSEYAMLDSMFAMDPVFPGLGLDQPFDLGWDTANIQQSQQMEQQNNMGFTFDNNTNNNNSNQEGYTGDNLGLDTQQPWMSWIDNSNFLTDGVTPIGNDGTMNAFAEDNGNSNGLTAETPVNKTLPESKGPTTIEGFLASTFGTKKSSSEVYRTVVKP